MRALTGMGLLSGAVLLLQVALTRVFSIAQFYHFAFLIVSLALLGFGASGSFLSIFPGLRRRWLHAWYALLFAAITLLAYYFVNTQPFDSYSIAWDPQQTYLMIANLLALAAPFAFAGALIGAMLSEDAPNAGAIYGANLAGSAAGAIIAPLAITALGSERVIMLSAVLGALAALILTHRRGMTILAGSTMLASLVLLAVYPSTLRAQPSQYKTLSHFRRNPDATIAATYQNAYSRVDIVHSPTIHSAQGLSLTYLGELPPQHGLLIDGDRLIPVADASRTSADLLRALPAAIAYRQRPDADALLLGSNGNMDTLAALANGASHVTVIEPNDLAESILRDDLRDWAGLATDSRVRLLHEQIRTFTQTRTGDYDIVQLPLSDNYRPITSGAFTLTEDYTLTVPAFRSYLDMLDDDGLLLINRWLQQPPSESLRLLGMLLAALEADDPAAHIVVYRSFQVATFVVKPSPFTGDEIDALLNDIADRRYDLVLAPRMPEDMINQYAVLETPAYHDTFRELLATDDRAVFYADYPFEVTPPTDNRPFFFHFFRWEQTPDVIQNLGRRWQPFGGSGYFMLLALLAFAVLAALVFILLPVALRHAGLGRSARALAYFTAIGLAFLIVEVALIQQYMLALGRPTLAIATVIGALLFFSGVGSALSPRLPWRRTLLILVVLLAVYPFIVDLISPRLLTLPVALRVIGVVLFIAPVGLLMGAPFPKGITALGDVRDLVPWAWASNGSASVITAVLAATLALSFGFTPVLIIGGGLYLIAAALSARF